MVATGLVATASPASAYDSTIIGYFFGSLSAKTEFGYFIEATLTSGSPYNVVQGGIDLQLGSHAVVTGATDCQAVFYVQLLNDSAEWNSPTVTRGCKYVLDFRDDIGLYETPQWSTSATAGLTHACVYLYYNHSSTAGWSRCVQGVWTSVS